MSQPQVKITVTPAGGPQNTPSYKDVVSITGAGSDNTYTYFNQQGVIDAWCLDSATGIDANATYTANVYSSYELAPLATLGTPARIGNLYNLDLVNWIINQNFTANPQYNYGEVQAAIWTLLGDTYNPNGSDLTKDGSVVASDVTSIVNLAKANGENFVPDTNQFIGVIFDPFVVNSNGSITPKQPLLGQVKAAKLGNFVWNDLNANGIQDAGESGITGVAVNLGRDSNSNGIIESNEILATTTTGAGGLYEFKGLTPGLSYQVQFTTPTGFDAVSPRQQGSIGAVDSDGLLSNVIILNPGEFNQTIDAGFYKYASVSGTVYVDANNNGVKDATETGIEGTIITLTGTDSLGNAVTVTTTTDANGNYTVGNLRPGTYNLTETQPTAYLDGKDAVGTQGGTLGNDNISTITLTSGTNGTGNNFGEVLASSISGTVYVDANNNGIKDATETGIEGTTINLTGTDDLGNAVSLTATTDVNGNYEFTNLRPGTNYTLTETQPTAYLDGQDSVGTQGGTLGNDNISTITLTSGTNGTGNNFGELVPASLGNFVFEDSNANGIQEAWEKGIAEATVNLLDADGNVIATTSTDANGLYSFTNLQPGDYKVQFVQPDGFSGISPTNVGGDDSVDSDGLISDVVNLSQGENDTTVDSGFYKTAALGDFVFNDSNNNGIQDASEAGISGVTVELINPADGSIIASVTTNANGGYNFSGLTPGDYQVQFTSPTGYSFSTANQGGDDALDSDANTTTGLTQTVTLTSGEFNGTLDAGLVPLASLGNFVFEDNNANGIQDVGEQGIAEATVNLLDADGNFIATTSTDANGLYSFTNLQPGDYKVQFVKPTGFNGVSPTNVGGDDSVDSDGLISDVVNLSPGENDTTVDSGFYKTASLGDFVFNDSNNNGIQDASEAGVSGVTVELINPADGSVIGTTTTNANGGYNFSGLTPGDYQLQFTSPSGYSFTKANQGGNDTLDSDANPSTGLTQTVTLTSGEFNGTLDAGLVPLASLGNFVFEDNNANGIQDVGEQGIAEATVNLLDADGNFIATTSTDANGLYSFTNLQPGDYKVQFVKPTGFNGVSPTNVGGDDSVDSDGLISDVVNLSPGENDTTVDSGFYKTASLGNFVFYDVNNNGIQEASEAGVEGVTVTLIGGGVDGLISTTADNTTITTTTNSGGRYNFSGLTPGQEYQVEFSNLPAGYQFTQADAGTDDALDSDANTSTGKTQIITLASGENNPTLDAGIYQNAGDLSITKTDGLTTVTPGQQITYTIVAQNNGLITATNALVSDIMPSNLTNVTWTSVATGGATDNQTTGTGSINDYVTLTAGSSITYTVTGTVAPITPTVGSVGTFSLGGNTATSGTLGNIRTFTATNGVQVKASAFSQLNGTTWSNAYLGSYGGGLGVTNSNEGDGSGNLHVVDNGSSNDYILFEFSESVVIDKASLGYVVGDSDMSIWIGTVNDPFNNHINLNSTVLSTLGFTEVNNGGSSTRTADINSGNVAGNVLVIAAKIGDTDDNFKVNTLDISKLTTTSPGTLSNTATITGPADFTDTNSNNNSATDTDTVSSAPTVKTGDLSITKTDGLTTVAAGQELTYTIVVSNNGLMTATNALVSDVMPTLLTNVTWTSVATGGATDNQTSGTGSINDYVTLTGGSSITYTVNGTVAANAVSSTPTYTNTTFDFNGNSSTDGTDGNTRTFTQDGISVTASAFSRVDGKNGTWNKAYLGSYTGGLGVTDSNESSSYHRVDNGGGRDNYVLFQFSESVVIDSAYLQYVVDDSDATVWIGNFNNTITTLSDSILDSFGFTEVNLGGSSDRWADINANQNLGNTLVIAAKTDDSNDQFKIRYLDIQKPVAPTTVSLTNTAKVTAPTGFTDTNTGNNIATDTDTVTAALNLPSAPGVRTPGFWANSTWQTFWDGIQGNEPAQKTQPNFAKSDLLFAPYTNSAEPGKVLDPVSGQYDIGLLIGDYNRNGKTDAGEDTLFYTKAQALQMVDSSQHPNGDKRYDLGRSLVAGWLNYLAGNPIDTANPTDKDERYYISEGINWLQAFTPDENGDKKGDGAIYQMTGIGNVYSPQLSNSYWSQGTSSASGSPSPYNLNTNVLYPLESGDAINSKLDDYNNGKGLADGVFYGG
ncbi:SdrD B-like domain-containing protein [Anabaena sp. PCC 7108]|uniref:SdrD B-like domain-containing protein n=1 Tax=Anabaena sp. PCC 7108 TaxID=163908 RepID=UPI00034A5DA7|nr:SdrD B-like domain-containing protein [Anabaena sp. PCC 7108]